MSKLPLSIAEDLSLIHREAEQLHWLVGMLAEEPAGVRDVWHWQWDGLMERYQRLCQLQQQGLLPESMEGEFLTVAQMLAEGRELIEALGCHVPPTIYEQVLTDSPSAS